MAAIAAISMLEPRSTGESPSMAELDPIVARVAAVEEVAGRFSVARRRGRPVRLLLAKNPAGWTAVFDLLDEEPVASAAVAVAINARTADGFDPSWLWDVPFERLAGPYRGRHR